MKPIKSLKRNFIKADYDNINLKLDRIDWHHELNFDEIDLALKKFYYLINITINEHVPLISPRSNDYPKWYSTRLIKINHEIQISQNIQEISQ